MLGALAEPDRAQLGQRADGLRQPLRMACTPAMNVVLTAPSPTSSTPSLPRGGAIWMAGCLMLHLRDVTALQFELAQFACSRAARSRLGSQT